MKKYTLSFALILLSSYSFCEAQTEQDTILKIEKPQNLFYKSTLNYINLKFDLESNNERFELEGDDFNYDIRSNV